MKSLFSDFVPLIEALWDLAVFGGIEYEYEYRSAFGFTEYEYDFL